jgi:hypothetical protein
MPNKRQVKTKELDIRGIRRESFPDTARDCLVSALNVPIVDSQFWTPKFSAWLATLVEEVRGQLETLKAGMLLGPEFYRRYDEHRKIFQQVQQERFLMPRPSYHFITTPSSKVPVEEQHQHCALSGLMELIEQGQLDYLRQCTVCQRWYLAERSDRVVCSKACRQKKYAGNPEYNLQRRKLYARKKRLEQKRKRNK